MTTKKATAAAKKKEEGQADEPEATSTELATTQEAGAATTYDYGDDAGAGFSDMKTSIPFVAVLQSNSKAVEKEGSALKAGMLFLTDTEEAFDGKTGLLFVPAVEQQLYVEWKNHDSGAEGLVARHAPDSTFVADVHARAGTNFGKVPIGPEKGANELVETIYVYGQLVSDDAEKTPLGAAVFGVSSTKIKAWQQIRNKIKKHMVVLPNGRKVNPPMFANLLRVTTETEVKKGKTFYNVHFAPAVGGDLRQSLLPTSHPAYVAARMIEDMVNKGKVAASAKGENGAGAPEDENGKF